MVVQIKLYNKGKHEAPSTKFILYEGTQLYFATVLAGIFNRIRSNIWIVISLIFTVAITILSFNVDGERSALLSAITFSFLLSNIQVIFHNSITNSKNKIPRFTYVLELLIFSSLFATFAAVFISDENHDLKREMDGFSKGNSVYVMTIIGQVVSWQIYWVGVVGLVLFVDSIVTSNVESVGPVVYAYSIVMVLKIMFCNYEEDEFDGFLGAALGLSFISIVTCFYKHIRFLKDIGNWKPPNFLLFLFLFVMYSFYLSELLNPDHYISPSTGFELL
ncbi:putative purine permease 14 [Raphanus sativus]|nr:putative purine permease 14 [Raphanus sativus]